MIFNRCYYKISNFSDGDFFGRETSLIQYFDFFGTILYSDAIGYYCSLGQNIWKGSIWSRFWSWFVDNWGSFVGDVGMIASLTGRVGDNLQNKVKFFLQAVARAAWHRTLLATTRTLPLPPKPPNHYIYLLLNFLVSLRFFRFDRLSVLPGFKLLDQY